MDPTVAELIIISALVTSATIAATVGPVVTIAATTEVINLAVIEHLKFW